MDDESRHGAELGDRWNVILVQVKGRYERYLDSWLLKAIHLSVLHPLAVRPSLFEMEWNGMYREKK